MPKKIFLILLLPFMAFTPVHKFYLSVSNIQYSEKDRALQVTTRIFIDDFDRALQERYGIRGNLATKEESSVADEYIEKYIRAKFSIAVNDANIPYNFLGKKYEDDIVICYLEAPNIDINTTTSISVQNEVLMDIFEEQKNVVHFKINDKKKSFVLIKENNKGMLNLR